MCNFVNLNSLYVNRNAIARRVKQMDDDATIRNNINVLTEMNFESHINKMIARISLFSIVALFDVKQIGVVAQFSGSKKRTKEKQNV